MGYTFSFRSLLIICPLVFLGGLIDSIAGGGGIINIPAYMLAGLPAHFCVGTNKLSSVMGSSVVVYRMQKKRYIDWKALAPAIVSSVLGSFLGAKLALLVEERILRTIMLAVIPFCLFVVLNPKLLREHPDAELTIDRKLLVKIVIVAFFFGIYEGFYGAGACTFLMIACVTYMKLSVSRSLAFMKTINLFSNLMALLVYLISGKTIVYLGLIAGIFNMLGNYAGSSLALKNGMKVVRPVMTAVILMLMLSLWKQ